MIKREIEPSWHPLTQDIPDADPEQMEALTRSFLTHDGQLELENLELRLAIRFLNVFHFRGRYWSDGEPYSGWVVGGNCPFLEFNDDEIETPMEALAMYSWFIMIWAMKKGVDDPPGSIPVYRVAPNWEPLSFFPGFDESRIGAITSFIGWKLVGEYLDEIRHPEVRARCIQRGWFNADGTIP